MYWYFFELGFDRRPKNSLIVGEGPFELNSSSGGWGTSEIRVTAQFSCARICCNGQNCWVMVEIACWKFRHLFIIIRFERMGVIRFQRERGELV